jgi:membrane protease YdiL (CAAX protease family)
MVAPEAVYRGTPGPLPAPRAPRPRVWTVFVALLGALLSAALFTGLVLGVFALTMAVRYAMRYEAQPPPTYLARALPDLLRDPVGILGSGLAACLSFALFALVPARLSAVGLVDRLRLRATPRWASLGLLGAGGVVGVGQVCSAVMVFAGVEGRGALGIIARAFTDAPAEVVVAAALIVGVGAGLGEELLFRGYMLTRLRDRWGPRVAVVVSAALFGLVHFDPWHSTFAFAVGLLLGWLSLRAGTVRSTIAAHVTNNLVSVAGMVVGDPSEPTPVAVAAVELVVGALLVVACVVSVRRLTRSELAAPPAA